MKNTLTLIIALFFLLPIFFQSCQSGKKEDKEGTSAEDSMKQAAIARGEYLANHVTLCMDCHSERNWNLFSAPPVPGTEGKGGEIFDQNNVGIPGTVYSRNITPDSATGIGTWADEDIIRAVTRGISKRGDTLFPIMPYVNYQQMSKYDLNCLIAYLRSLKPIHHEVPKRNLMVPIGAVYATLPLDKSQPEIGPPMTDQVAYGGYMTTIAACFDCHTPMVKGAYDLSKAFAGGFCFNIPQGTVCSANITPDSATGIGTWNEEKFLAKFTPYRDPATNDMPQGDLYTIMPVRMYSGMKDEDLKAIYAFLRTLPPNNNKIEVRPKASGD